MDDINAGDKFGPSVWLVPYMTLHSYITWLGVLVLALFRIQPLQRWLHSEPSVPLIQEALASLNDWMLDHHGPLIALGLICLSFLRTLILYMSADYSIDGEALNVRYGFLCPGVASVTNVTNTLMFSMLIDINISQNPFQFLFNTGHLDLKMMDGEQVRMLCVADPKTAKHLLLSRSNADKVRLYAPLRQGSHSE